MVVRVERIRDQHLYWANCVAIEPIHQNGIEGRIHHIRLANR
jgi:hypothetical protein